jgi:hypothetical protein
MEMSQEEASGAERYRASNDSPFLCLHNARAGDEGGWFGCCGVSGSKSIPVTFKLLVSTGSSVLCVTSIANSK